MCVHVHTCVCARVDRGHTEEPGAAWVCGEGGQELLGLAWTQLRLSPLLSLVTGGTVLPPDPPRSFPPWKVHSDLEEELCQSNMAPFLIHPPHPTTPPSFQSRHQPSFACLLDFVVFSLDVVRERWGRRTSSPPHFSPSPDRQTGPAWAQRPSMIPLTQQMGKF